LFWVLGLAAISMVLMFIVMLLVGGDTPESPSSKAHAGGPSTYKQYHGEAQIDSITPLQETPDAYDIKFTFHPREAVREAFANPENRQWSLFRNDFSFPKEDFLKKHDIQIGKRLPCIMNVITRGSSTPVLFDFPTIDEGRGQ